MYRAILVPLDGSTFAQDALPMGRIWARTLGADLHLAHVIRSAPDVDFKTPLDDFDWKVKAREWADDYLKACADKARSDGVRVVTAVLEGPVAPALAEYSEKEDIDLVALTSHGSGGVRRWWLGSVADRLLRASTCDVLLVRPWDDTADRVRGVSRFDRLLVPLDGSKLAEVALRSAAEITSRFGAEVRAVMVLPRSVELTSILGVPGVELRGEGYEERLREAERYLKDLIDRADLDGLQGSVVESGGAAEGVIEAASEWNADLIVISTHGRGGLARAVIGSVADKVVRGATQPVLVVRAPSED